MTAVQIVLLVAGTLVVIGGVNAVVWTVIIGKLRRLPAQLRLDLESAGERVVRGPERGRYRGSSAAGYGHVQGLGVVALTDRRLVFQKVAGKRVDVPLDQITGVREVKMINRARTLVCLALSGGGEIAFSFSVSDPEVWTKLFSDIAQRRQP